MKIKKYLISIVVLCCISILYRSTNAAFPLLADGKVNPASVILTVSSPELSPIDFEVAPSDSQQDVINAVAYRLATVYSRFSADERKKIFGDFNYGLYATNWHFTYNGQPFESFKREQVIGSTDKEMQELYKNGPLRAVYKA